MTHHNHVGACREAAAEAAFPEEARLLIFDLRSQPHYRIPLALEGASHKTDRAGRGLFFTRPDSADICVLPSDFDHDHLNWLYTVGLGPHPSQIHFVEKSEADVQLLSTSCNSDQVKKHFSKSTVVPFYVGPDEDSLSKALGENRLFGSSEEIALVFNDKISNKELCRRAGLPTVSGLAISSNQTLHEKLSAAFQMLEAEGNIIIRTARGSGGSGIAIVRGEDPSADDVLHTFFSSHGRSESCLIEAFLPVVDSLNIQFAVSSSQLTFIGMSAQLLAGGTKHEGNQGGYRFLGDRIPIEFREAARGASTLARLAQEIGYEGILGFDFILTESGETYCIETNARVNGSTLAHQVVHHVAARHREMVPDLTWALVTLDTAFKTFWELSHAIQSENLSLLKPGTLDPDTHIVPVEHLGDGRWSVLVIDSHCEHPIEYLTSQIAETLSTSRFTSLVV